MLWHQGESNAGNTQAVYESRLTEFIADVRSLYGANLPFMVGEIGLSKPGNDAIVAAQQAVAAADPYSVFVPASDFSFGGDDVHFNQAGMITLGQRFANYYNSNFAGLVDTSGDFTPPAPAQMGWASPPTAILDSLISMTAITASDENGVEGTTSPARPGAAMTAAGKAAPHTWTPDWLLPPHMPTRSRPGTRV